MSNQPARFGSSLSRVVDSGRDCLLLHSNITRDESALVLLQSKLSEIATRFKVDERKRENMLLVAAELVSNNVKHAGGKAQIQVWQHPGPILDIFSWDYGPGIADFSLAERDGYSTANTFGKGLGAIRRLSDESHVYTQARQSGRSSRWSGTALMARFNIAQSKERVLGASIGIFSRALSDTRHNGDRIYLQKRGDAVRWLHLDGLGHGEGAALATANLTPCVSHNEDLEQLLEDVETQLCDTRGAVAAVCEIDTSKRQLQLLGVGDMHAHLYEKEEMSHLNFAPGILGRAHRSIELVNRPLARHNRIITASDGIRRNWDISNFPGLFDLHPQLIAYTLGNIMGRASDDQSICVYAVR